MKILQYFYCFLHRVLFSKEEKSCFASIWWPNKIRIIALKLLLEGKGFLLDIGCGEGLMLGKLVDSGVNLRIIAVDNSFACIIKSRNRIKPKKPINVDFLREEASRLSFKSNIFSSCLCLNLFLCLSSENQVKEIITEIVNTLKPGGKFIFDIRNSLNPLLYFKYKLAIFYDSSIKNQPLRTYRIKRIRQILEESNLKVSKEIGIGFFVKKFAPAILIEAEKL
jgi:SAM-dependent methyltransferase